MPTTEAASQSPPQQIPYVEYLVLDDPPYLRANECTDCAARYFDRRNACVACFGTDFDQVRVADRGVVTSFSIVTVGPEPFVSAVVDCDGTAVRCTLVDVEPSPDHVSLGMEVELRTYSMGTDAGGTEAIGYGFAPATEPKD